jgi:hypothetical protein
MDATTNSVYTSSDAEFYAFTEKSKDGGYCKGNYLGPLRQGCTNLNDEFSEGPDQLRHLLTAYAMQPIYHCANFPKGCRNFKSAT